MPRKRMPRKRSLTVVVTCEHAGNRVPAEVEHHFHQAEDALKSHRGWDPGALPLAERFAAELQIPLLSADVSRLVVEPNRSMTHPKLFSEFTRHLTPDERAALLRNHWHPHRNRVKRQIDSLIDAGRTVVHLSVHTFTEVLGDEVRTTDVGLLYDPRRELEKKFCQLWQNQIITINSAWKVRRNHPYKGSSDGLTTHLRKQFEPGHYLGIELEVCQKFFLRGGTAWDDVLAKVPGSFADSIGRLSLK